MADLAKMFFENPDAYYRITRRQVVTKAEEVSVQTEYVPKNSVAKNKIEEQIRSQIWFDLDKMVYIDTETTNGHGAGSLDPFDPESDVALIQTNVHGKIELHRKTPEVIAWLQKLHDEGYTFVFHNADFDINFLKAKTGLQISRVFDTMIASMVLNAGKVKIDKATELAVKVEKKVADNEGFYDMLVEEDEQFIEFHEKKKNRFSHSLQATAYRYANVVIQKDVGNSDWAHEPLTPDQIRYAKEDVQHLPRILMNQLYFAMKYNLMPVLELEMAVVPVTADMRFQGVLFDVETWEEMIQEYEKEANELEDALNHQIGLMMSKHEEKEEGLLFDDIPVAFEVSSNDQLTKFLQAEGHKVEDVGEATLKTIDEPIVHKILHWREVNKIATTYGKKFLRWVRQDGRIHGQLKQAETATGRYSSNRPNLQNIPADMLKGKMKARDGYILMTADYSSVESRILAYAAEDQKFIDSVNSNDVHTENARKIFKIPEDMAVDGELRKKAKGLSFGIPYGISAAGIVGRGFADTKEEGQKLIDLFYDTFPQVKQFLANSVQQALIKHYTQDAFGRVRFYEIPSENEASEKEIKSIQEEVRRQAQNHPIQSLSASITKRALADCWAYLMETGYGYVVLTVHDSIFFELKEEYAHIAIPELHRLMELSGPRIMGEGKILTPVDYDLGVQYKESDVITGLKFKQYSLVFVDNKVVSNPNRISPDTKAVATKFNMMDLLKSDPIGFMVQLKPLIEQQDVEWQKKNEKWLKAYYENYNNLNK